MCVCVCVALSSSLKVCSLHGVCWVSRDPDVQIKSFKKGHRTLAG